jgi:ParB family chromosome partitioning protein
LTPAERAMFTKRRKDIYEALHPETKSGQAQAIGMHKSLGNNVSANLAPTFTEDTISKTGQSERVVQMEAARGNRRDWIRARYRQ